MLWLLPLFAFITACAPQPSVLPTTTPTVVEASPEPVEAEEEAVVHALEEETTIIQADDPWTLVNRAQSAPPDQQASYLLPAIAGFIDAGQLSTAQTLIEQVEAGPLDASQRIELTLHRARLNQALGHHPTTIAMLDQLERGAALSPESQARLLGIKATSQRALRQNDDAVASLIQRDTLLQGPERLENQVDIVNQIAALDPLSRSLLRETGLDRNLEGWIALGEILPGMSPTNAEAQRRQWRQLYPDHPAEDALFVRYGSTTRLNSYRHIALLLPLTSPYGRAARAFYDGFSAAHQMDTSLSQPTISLHDIGEEPFQARLYYQAAVNEGADFVIGPLGRQAVAALLEGPEPELPTLVIGDVPGDREAPGLFGISLSPEAEARQVAERAFLDGHRQAGVFRSSSDWGQRVADAFVLRWEELGGTTVENSSFPPDISDYSRIIQKLLGIDRSVVRERLLSAQLGVDLKFTPRRREDLDFLFMAANAAQARLVVPQLRFFQAHDLPLYGTSYVYGGGPDPANDADLDGLVFGDMRWILERAYLPEPEPEPEEPGAEGEAENADDAAVEAGESATDADPAEAATTIGTTTDASLATDSAAAEGISLSSQRLLFPGDPAFESPYHHTSLDRLYALGLDSYHLVPRLTSLRASRWERFHGQAMDLGVTEDGNVVRHPAWAKFKDGMAVSLPPHPAGLRAVTQ